MGSVISYARLLPSHTRRRGGVGISSCVDLSPSVPPRPQPSPVMWGLDHLRLVQGSRSRPLPVRATPLRQWRQGGHTTWTQKDLGWLDFQLGHFLTGGLASLSLSVLLGGLGWGVGRRQCTEHQSKTPRVTLPWGQLRMGERPRGLQDGPWPQRLWARCPGGKLLHLPALSPHPTAYQITHRLNATSANAAAVEVLAPSARQFTATGLKPESVYLFRITAQTRKGWGEAAEALVVTTEKRGDHPLGPGRGRALTPFPGARLGGGPVTSCESLVLVPNGEWAPISVPKASTGSGRLPGRSPSQDPALSPYSFSQRAGW